MFFYSKLNTLDIHFKLLINVLHLWEEQYLTHLE